MRLFSCWGVSLLLLALAVVGCGGGGGGGGSATGGGTGTTVTPSIAITWGARPRAVTGPASADRATVRILRTDRLVAEGEIEVARRPEAAQYTESYTFPRRLAPGSYEISVVFYGTGRDVCAEANGRVNLTSSGQLETVTVQSEAKVGQVTVLPDQTVQVGQTIVPTVEVRSKSGEILAISPKVASYRVESGNAYLTIQSGSLRGTEAGVASIVATVDGVSSDPAEITVQKVRQVFINPPYGTSETEWTAYKDGDKPWVHFNGLRTSFEITSPDGRYAVATMIGRNISLMYLDADETPRVTLYDSALKTGGTVRGMVRGIPVNQGGIVASAFSSRVFETDGFYQATIKTGKNDFHVYSSGTGKSFLKRDVTIASSDLDLSLIPADELNFGPEKSITAFGPSGESLNASITLQTANRLEVAVGVGTNGYRPVTNSVGTDRYSFTAQATLAGGGKSSEAVYDAVAVTPSLSLPTAFDFELTAFRSANMNLPRLQWMADAKVALYHWRFPRENYNWDIYVSRPWFTDGEMADLRFPTFNGGGFGPHFLNGDSNLTLEGAAIETSNGIEEAIGFARGHLNLWEGPAAKRFRRASTTQSARVTQ